MTINLTLLEEYMAGPETARFERAEILMTRNAEEVINNLAKFNLTEEHRFEIGRNFVLRDPEKNFLTMVVSHLELLNLSEEHRYKLASEMIQKNPQFLIHLNYFNLSEVYRFKLAQHLVSEKPKLLTQLIYFRLSETQNFEIAKNLSQIITYDQRDLLYGLTLTPEHSFEIIQVLTRRFPKEMIRNIQELNIDETQQRALCITASEKKYGLAEFFPICLRPCYTAFYGEEEESQLAWAIIPLPILESIERVVDKVKAQLEDFNGNEDFLKELKEGICDSVDYWRLLLTDEQLTFVGQENFLDMLNLLPTPGSWETLIKTVKEVAIDPNCYVRLQSNNKSLTIKLLKLPLALLAMHGVDLVNAEQGQDNANFMPITSIIEQQEEWLKDPMNSDFLYTMFEQLARCTFLSVQQKNEVIQELSQNPSEFLTKISHLGIIINCQRMDLLQIEEGESLHFRSRALRAFHSSYPTIDMSKFREIFDLYRDPDSMMLYGSGLVTLNDSAVTQSLSDHILSVIDGTYKAQRYSANSGLHMSTLHRYDPTIVDKWSENESISFTEITRENPADEISTFGEWVRELVINKCVFGKIDKYIYLQNFLNGDPKAMDQLIQAKKSMKNLSVMEQRDLSLQSKICQLAKVSARESILTSLGDCKTNPLFADFPHFRDAIREKLEHIEVATYLDTLSVVNTDSPEDLLLVGSEGMKSCQNYCKDPEFNKGLLGYLHHGQTRLIAVKDQEGKIVARSILRLLWDRNKPVLFLEKIYTHQKDDRFEKVILGMANNRSAKLGVSLAIRRKGGVIFNKVLESFQSKAPFEYVDVVGGLKKRGRFQIPPAYLQQIYSPIV